MTEEILELATDEDLIGAISNGSEVAFAELFRRYDKRVRGFCRGKLSGADTAADVSQEVFLKVYLCAHQFTKTGKFRKWLFKLVYRHCIERYRYQTAQSRNASEALPGDSEDAFALDKNSDQLVPYVDEDPIHRLRLSELSERIKSAMLSIHQTDPRVAWALQVMWDGKLTQTQACRQVGISKTTLQRWMERGYELLRERLSDFEDLTSSRADEAATTIGAPLAYAMLKTAVESV